MKKLKLHELVIVAIICILICCEFAIISREIIGISGDFIAAGTTLFASFVAYMIFTDWREQHRVDMLKEIRKNIHVLFNDCENRFHEFYVAVGKTVKGAPLEMKDITKLSQSMADSFELLMPEIDFLKKVLNEFNATLESEESNLDDITPKLLNLMVDLCLAKVDCNTTTVGNYWAVLSGFSADNFLKLKKSFINDDLQKLILKFYKIN